MKDVLEKIEKGESKLIQTGTWLNRTSDQIHQIGKEFFLVNMVETSQGVQFSGQISKINKA